ncbi:hypothetical protein [Halorussus sp. MSC15.2]|uniref:hypothetical protein n=1 Tax=Halorussus sp. MSC15.2 TaxID=2283638 RepID=UPI0013D10F84|nr:hypothetical protein [Halorussus sp. MSC15.2]NEU58352.1 hypothetical protein [Halorussus sp. MSC15.2]
MKQPATPPADEAAVRIESYERTNSDGNPELVLYNPDESHEWINAAPASTVELEDWR